MTKNDAIVAVFTDHHGAEDAVRKLAGSGLDIKHFSIIGKRVSHGRQSSRLLKYW
jgi:hypothetical protein